jgi:hypothetical protein
MCFKIFDSRFICFPPYVKCYKRYIAMHMMLEVGVYSDQLLPTGNVECGDVSRPGSWERYVPGTWLLRFNY